MAHIINNLKEPIFTAFTESVPLRLNTAISPEVLWLPKWTPDTSKSVSVLLNCENCVYFQVRVRMSYLYRSFTGYLAFHTWIQKNIFSVQCLRKNTSGLDTVCLTCGIFTTWKWMHHKKSMKNGTCFSAVKIKNYSIIYYGDSIYIYPGI